MSISLCEFEKRLGNRGLGLDVRFYFSVTLISVRASNRKLGLT